jgi:hypothetical protein
VERQLSSPAIQFKGSGWYITDYARKGSAGGKGAEAVVRRFDVDRQRWRRQEAETKKTESTPASHAGVRKHVRQVLTGPSPRPARTSSAGS